MAGLDPGPAIRRAEQQILDGRFPSPGGSPDRWEVPFELAGLADVPMFGRDPQLETVGERVRTALAGHRSSVLALVGESGAGKTLLAAHLAAALVGDGVRVVATAIDELGEAPLAPVRRVLGYLAEHRLSDGAVEADSLDPRAGPNGRAGLIERALRELAAAAATGPLVVVFDDTHWADELTIELLRRTARTPFQAPVVVVVTERASRRRVVGRGIEEVAVERLSADVVAEWLGPSADQEVVQAVLEATGGLGWLVAEAVEHRRRGGPSSQLAGVVGPRLLQDRLDRSGSDALTLLEWGAVIGTLFRIDDLMCLLPITDLEVLERVDRLVASGVLAPQAEDPSGFRFDHALLRDAVLAHIGSKRSSRMHREVLDVLGTRMNPVERWVHIVGAPMDTTGEEIGTAALAAATWLHDRYAFDQAAEIARQGLLGLGAPPDPAVGAGLHLVVARSAETAGRPVEARTHLAEAERQAAESGSDAARAAVFVARAMFGHRFVGDRAAIGEIGSMLAGEALDDAARFGLLRALASVHLREGELTQARSVLSEAQRLVPGLGARATAECWLLEHWLHESGGERQARAGVADRLAELAAAGPDPLIRTKAAAVGVIEAFHAGDRRRALRLIDELERWADAAGEPHAGWIARAARFTPAFVEGDLDAATRWASEARDFGLAHGLVEASGTWATQLFALGWVRGDVSAFLDRLRSIDTDGSNVVWSAALALGVALHGEATEAYDVLDGLVGELATSADHWLGFVGVGVAVEAASLVGHQGVLESALVLLTPRRADHVVLGTGAMDYGPVSRFEGLARAGLGDLEGARLLLESVSRDRSAGRIWQQKAALDLARWGAGGTATGTVPSHVWVREGPR